VKLWTKEELDAWLSVMSVSGFLNGVVVRSWLMQNSAPTGSEFAHAAGTITAYTDG
jgi:hypothetical protein